MSKIYPGQTIKMKCAPNKCDLLEYTRNLQQENEELKRQLSKAQEFLQRDTHKINEYKQRIEEWRADCWHKEERIRELQQQLDKQKRMIRWLIDNNPNHDELFVEYSNYDIVRKNPFHNFKDFLFKKAEREVGE